jgi:hypothetical protein
MQSGHENGALLTAGTEPYPALRAFQETFSWLSLATRSKASVEFLIRY